MSAAYAWEKLYLAVRALATENQPLRGRLYDVYWHNLLILKTHPIPWDDCARSSRTYVTNSRRQALTRERCWPLGRMKMCLVSLGR